MKLIHFVLLLACATPVWAGLNSAVIVLPFDNGAIAPAVTIVQPADYLCAVVTLRTTARDADRQSNAMRETLQKVSAAVEKSPRFQLHQGAVRFRGTNPALFASKAGSGAASLQTSLRVLCPLAGNADVFEAMRQLRRFLATLPTTDETEITVASITLAVAAPEQYRERLLALIADQSRTVQHNFGARTIIVDGLQNPVVVRQVDDSNVELSVDYQMSATLEIR